MIGKNLYLNESSLISELTSVKGGSGIIRKGRITELPDTAGGGLISGINNKIEVEELEEKDEEVKARENREAIMDSLLVKEILSSMLHYFVEPDSEEEKKKVVDLVIEAVLACDLTYGEKAAIKWGDGFQWKKDQLDADLNSFKECGMDLTEMARRRLNSLKANRLNMERVSRLREDNPERGRLEGSCVGMQAPRPKVFIPNGQSSSRGLHKVYQRVYHAVNKMLGDLHNQQLGIILPESLAREFIIHHRMLGKWALKKDKESGRNIGDMSYGALTLMANGRKMLLLTYMGK